MDSSKRLPGQIAQQGSQVQSISDTPSATSVASDASSRQTNSGSTATSQSTAGSRKYTIIASRDAPSGPRSTARSTPTRPLRNKDAATAVPEDDVVHVSQPLVLERSDEPRSLNGLGISLEPEVPSEAWWNDQTGIDKPMNTLTISPSQQVGRGTDSVSPSFPSRLPRRKHNYPPTSYRDPFLRDQGDDDLHDQPRLASGWKPPGYRPSPAPVVPSTNSITQSRPRRNSTPTSTDGSKPSPSHSRDILIPTKHTRAAASIEIAPTPYSPPETIAKVAPKSTSRSSSFTSASSRGTRRSDGSHLPPPEKVYGQLIYFINCSHTSPPANRPIDIQPVLQPLSRELNDVPSQSIKAQIDLCARTGRQKQIYTILGLCPGCDWRTRRDLESDVLRDFAQQRYQMEQRIAHLEIAEGEETPDSPLTPEQPISEPSDKQVDLQLDILTLETDIEELQARQDEAVKKLWKGYAKRWGPAAVGIQKSVERREVASRTSLSTENSVDSIRAEGTMRLDWIRPDTKG